MIPPFSDLFVGAYVTTEDALNNLLSAENLWEDKQYEKALALIAVRSLIVEKGQVFIGKDFDNIHGKAYASTLFDFHQYKGFIAFTCILH